MLPKMFIFCLLTLDQTPGGGLEHAHNPVYQDLRQHEMTIDGARVPLPAPVLSDGQSAEEQRQALLQVAGSEQRLEELLRDSITAPFLVKVRDQKTEHGDLIRLGDLWFVIHADLDQINPTDGERIGAESKSVEAGNMRLTSRLLKAEDLDKRGIKKTGEEKGFRREWYVHLTGRLLDRIHVEVTDRVTASRSDESWVIASRTDPKFDRDEQFPNQWRSLNDEGQPGPDRPRRYAGGTSYVKITRLAAPQGALLVEAHFAFTEPHDWFEGAPTLRSKISLIAQDRIRRLRRELAKSQQESEPRKR